jgi:hypothetical protein
MPDSDHQLAVTLAVTGMPEYMAVMRDELVRLLLEAAADEPPEVAARLREVAEQFQTGLAEL